MEDLRMESLLGACCEDDRFGSEVYKRLFLFDQLGILVFGYHELSPLNSGHDVSIRHQLDAHCLVLRIKNLAAVGQVRTKQDVIADVV
jgi:hypothetical protein